MKLPPSKPNPELDAAIEKARHHVMTAEEKFEQRVSFVYGQQDYDKPARNKDEIRKHVAESIGFPLDEIATLRADCAKLSSAVLKVNRGNADLRAEIATLKASIADEREDAARAALAKAVEAIKTPNPSYAGAPYLSPACKVRNIDPASFRSRQP